MLNLIRSSIIVFVLLFLAVPSFAQSGDIVSMESLFRWGELILVIVILFIVRGMVPLDKVAELVSAVQPAVDETETKLDDLALEVAKYLFKMQEAQREDEKESTIKPIVGSPEGVLKMTDLDTIYDSQIKEDTPPVIS